MFSTYSSSFPSTSSSSSLSPPPPSPPEISIMARETTPTPFPAQAAPSTPGASTTTYPTTPGAGAGATMRVQRQTPIPSTPGGVHRRIPSTTVPRTPGTSPLSGCSSEPGAFTTVRVHTAKCSECDMRNKDTMLRCPGCTFQVCKPCQDRREKGGRSLTHGNMPSPAAGTPRVGTPGSVVRRRPVGITVTPTLVKNAEKGKGKEIGHQKEEVKSAGTEAGVVEVKSAAEVSTGRKRVLKSKPKPKMREATPSDDSSNDDFAPDPGSPTANKRRRTKVFQENDGDSDTRSPLVKSADDTEVSAKPPRGEVPPANKPPSDMTTNELLAHHGVNTPANPYKAHIMSRHEPVVSNPVIQIPEAVKRGFKPRPTAEEIQKNIQDKVRHKLGLLLPEPRDAGDE